MMAALLNELFQFGQFGQGFINLVNPLNHVGCILILLSRPLYQNRVTIR